ncbi:MAG: NAD(P)-binding domain-containing protein [Anaerolineae bacterium]|nr:NAD(P)-binding domain-containing protein [Anaerolineae bacterium]NUQ03544.1 NAD(P)-binding domain-containing protein [Anaerolineae bacterium]
MTVIYHDEDGDLNALSGKSVAIIGYGNMGRPVALNLRDSGIQVLVSEPRQEKMEQAEREGFELFTMQDAVQGADIIMPLLRDEEMPQIYIESVSPWLQRGQALIFSSAYNLTYGLIEAPPFVDVGLVSARTFGAAVRERFLTGDGYASFVAVAQDSSRQAWELVLAIAKGMGALRGGAVEVQFEQETELDLFLQQSVLPLFHRVVISAAQILMESGYSPEAVFTELYLSGETADYLRTASQFGLLSALEQQALPAQYGMLSRLERLNALQIERLMETTLREIRDRKFAEEWSKEYHANYPRLRHMLRQRREMELWELEKQTLELLHPEFD